MSKKDFELIADVFCAQHRQAESADAANIIDAIAHKMADRLDNAHQGFNRTRFLSACGVA